MPNYPYHEKTKKPLSRSRSHDDLKELVRLTDTIIQDPGPISDKRRIFGYRLDEYTRLKTKTTLTIVECMVDAKPTFVSVDDVEDLRKALATESWASRSLHGNDQQALRLYIVEDLSTDVVELLGSRYNIDPLFFSTQYDFRDYGDGGLSEALRLQVSKKHRKWVHIDNVRMYWDKSLSFGRGPEDDNTQDFNVDRGLDSHHTDRDQGYISILSTRSAFWLEKDGEGGPFIGIVLVDPTTSMLCGDNRDKSISRPTTTNESEKAPTQGTWYSAIVEISSRFLRSQPFPLGNATTLMAVVYPATIAVCAEWLKICHFYSIILDRYPQPACVDL